MEDGHTPLAACPATPDARKQSTSLGVFVRPGTKVRAVSLLSSPLPTPVLAARQDLPPLGASGPLESTQPCSPASSFLLDSGRASAASLEGRLSSPVPSFGHTSFPERDEGLSVKQSSCRAADLPHLPLPPPLSFSWISPLPSICLFPAVLCPGVIPCFHL